MAQMRYLVLTAFLALAGASFAAEGGRLDLQKQIDYEQTTATSVRAVRFTYQASLTLNPGVELVRLPDRPPASVKVTGPNGVTVTLQYDGRRTYFFRREV